MADPPDIERPAGIAYSTAADLKAVRGFVAARAASLGLSAPRVELLILAVSELATNTLLYTENGGRVSVWAEPHQLVCDVVDRGPVLGFGQQMPPAGALRGRGLAIVERVCDGVEATAVADGTRIRIRMSI